MKLEDLKDYNLVWSEEFDGESLNDTKLTFKEDVLPTKNMEGEITYDYCDCQRVATVKDGKLILNCFFDEERNCFIGPKPVETKNTMSFKYGYLEIRARIPYTHGAEPSIDAFAKEAIGWEKDATYYSHMKIVTPSDGQNVTNNLIKEYENYDENHPFYEKGKKSVDTSYGAQFYGTATPDCIHSRYTELCMDDFKTYGVLWTPNFIIFTVNGYVNTRVNLTKDFLRPSGLDGFKKPHYLQFKNLLTVDNETVTHLESRRVTQQDVLTQCPMEIDYIRLYQKDGEGELNIN
ncbi:MAG: family 16 glycosylhydrolase [Clostridia bacterium]|nr:family 16 glycosylhydrolase [Clostridia bacterium]